MTQHVYCFKIAKQFCTGPYPPTVSVEVYYPPSLSPTILVTIHGLPHWHGYEMSEYSVNITNTRNNSLLYKTTIPNYHENNTAFFMWSLVNQSLIAQECNTLRISVSAVNVAYGKSEPAQTDIKLLKGKSIKYYKQKKMMF